MLKAECDNSAQLKLFISVLKKLTQKYPARAGDGGAVRALEVRDLLPAVVVGEDEVEAPHVHRYVGVQHRVKPDPRQWLSFHFSAKIKINRFF